MDRSGRRMLRRMLVKNIIWPRQENRVFQLLVLKDDPDRTVESEEIKDINLIGTKVRTHLQNGESVFITTKHEQSTKQL